MAKIICPHCQAVNQDVSLNDPCWKCGTVLGAPASALETAVGPPSSIVNSNEPAPAKPMTKVQQALAQSEAPPVPVYAEPPRTVPNRALLLILLAIFLVAVLTIVVLVWTHR
jgi:hypothetical protein